MDLGTDFQMEFQRDYKTYFLKTFQAKQIIKRRRKKLENFEDQNKTKMVEGCSPPQNLEKWHP